MNRGPRQPHEPRSFWGAHKALRELALLATAPERWGRVMGCLGSRIPSVLSNRKLRQQQPNAPSAKLFVGMTLPEEHSYRKALQKFAVEFPVEKWVFCGRRRKTET